MCSFRIHTQRIFMDFVRYGMIRGYSGGMRRVKIGRASLVALGCIASVLALGVAAPVAAQTSRADQLCIATFNKGARSVAKVQGQIISKCLRDFASGHLTATTPEVCIRTDNGKLSAAIDKAVAKANDKCSNGVPGYGVTPVSEAMVQAVLSEIDLAHGSFGRDLDTSILPTASGAACQSKVGAALMKCSDRRISEYLKCQKTGMHNGSITDAASLAATCLGTGNGSQPDSAGHIDLDCGTKVGSAIARSCVSTDLGTAFAPCNAADPATAATCLKNQSACQACLALNKIDGLSRDCDAFDDGNPNNGSCGSECPDGIVQLDEACDDNNSSDNDGCSSHCTIEGGWTCTGQPSVCSQKCGDGTVDAGEVCDDGGRQSGDGCSSTCEVESGYSCSGQPSVCVHKCGNGTVDSSDGEACDDHNTVNGDGCSNTCQIEGGFVCSGSPSVCTFVCGNGTFQTGETCDDHNSVSGDGCSHTCRIETGWLCSGQPSVCTPVCGDGLKRGAEGCDDGNTLSGDGCSFTCQPEVGFQCSGQPSHCSGVCGDGFIRGFETCDDGNTHSGDGCSGDFCRQEASYSCAGQPSVCGGNCGNGILNSPEQCDDGNHTNGDGCNSLCQTEVGYACAGQPSVCGSTCGNGVLNVGEGCDDGNTLPRDGCSPSCVNESGWYCPTNGSPCQQFEVVIDSPANGTFSNAGSIVVSGHYTVLPAGQVTILVNGTPASSVNQVNRTFSTTVTLNQSIVFNPIAVTLINTANNDDVHDRITVIAGPSVADGSFSPQSVAMRLNDTGLDAMEPLVASLAGSQLDLATILPAGTTLVDNQCFINAIGCWGSASVKIANPAPSFSNVTLQMDSKTNAVQGDIRIFNLRVDVDIEGSGLVPNCGLRLTADVMLLSGDYALQPLASDPSDVDVNLVTPMSVVFSGFNHTFTSGLCDAPVIGDIINAFLPDIQQTASDGIKSFLADPDGSGPQDSPIASAIQSVLAGISITGPVGAGLGLMLESPLFEVVEDTAGITLGSDSRFQVSVGSGPGQCIPPAGAPNLTASYSKAAAFPTFGATTPVSHSAYGLGIGISTAGFNQLLRGQTECGLMRSSMTTIDLDGSGPQPSVPITSTLLSLIVPEFAQLPADTPLRIDIAPTIAPIVTGNAGPNGELTELKVAQVIMNVVEPGPEITWLRGALDARLGMNLAFLPDGSGLAITLSEPQTSDVAISVIDNPLGASESQVETVLPALVRPLIPQLAGALSGFPLPQFFGLSLQGVEVSRTGQFVALYANLAAAP